MIKSAGYILSCLLWAVSAQAQDLFLIQRKQMVEIDLKGRGIAEPQVLQAFLKVPRELFVRPIWKHQTYADNPLPIGEGQTISQPYVVALMTEALKIKPGEKVLEIGTGSGYQAAILRELTNKVYTIEIDPKLTEFAKENLKKAGYLDIQVKTGDGFFGWEEFAPFDAIVVTCAADPIPLPLKNQLKVGGRLILPLGEPTHYQTLVLVTKKSEKEFSAQTLGDVRFVPMTGAAQKADKPW